MIQIAVEAEASKIIILGHGLNIASRFELAPGISLEPTVPKLDVQSAASGSRQFHDYAAALTGSELATFSMEVEGETGSNLGAKAWNFLWIFHLLSLACSSPCFSLYAITNAKEHVYTAANRNLVFRPLPKIVGATSEQLTWAKAHLVAFNHLISDASFGSAMRCYGNSHYLFDLDTRIMLLWAGIEGLLSVDGELNRRLALYAALLHKGTAEEKIAYFKVVKKAYGIRSKAVHGGKAAAGMLEAGYRASSDILVRLLARCVELGRVPTPAEFDALSVSQTVAWVSSASRLRWGLRSRANACVS